MRFLIVLLCGVAASYAVGRVTPALTDLPGAPTRRVRLVIALLGAGCLLLVTARLGVGWVTLKWYVLVVWLLAITLTDIVSQLIPDRLTYSGTVIGVVAAALVPREIAAVGGQWLVPHWLGLFPGGPMAGITLSVLGALVGFLAVEGFRRTMGLFAGSEVMGMGDSKLVMLLGSFLGPFMVVLALVPGVLAGVILGYLFTTVARRPYSPLGPALALGGLITALYPREMIGILASSVRFAGTLGAAGTIAAEAVLLVTCGWLLWRLRSRAAGNIEILERDYADQVRQTEEEPGEGDAGRGPDSKPPKDLESSCIETRPTQRRTEEASGRGPRV